MFGSYFVQRFPRLVLPLTKSRIPAGSRQDWSSGVSGYAGAVAAGGYLTDWASTGSINVKAWNSAFAIWVSGIRSKAAVAVTGPNRRE